MTTQDAGARKLGRGLAALLQTPIAVTPPPASSAAPTAIADGGIRHIEIDLFVPSPFQARRSFDEQQLRGLADSIRVAGIMQPVVARPVGGGFELVAGERRWRAARLAELKTIPTLVRILSDEEAAEFGLIENVQREDLNAIDRAHALRTMCARFGLTQAQVAEKVGLERATVANLIRLTELEPEIAELIASNGLSSAHGKMLLAMVGGPQRIELAREASRDQWSVRRLESAVKRFGSPRSAAKEAMNPPARQAVILDLERRLSQHLGTKAIIATDASGSKGRITVEFYGIDHFDGLLAKMGLK
jgi:ParB family chromosome partitioning protein